MFLCVVKMKENLEIRVSCKEKKRPGPGQSTAKER